LRLLALIICNIYNIIFKKIVLFLAFNFSTTTKKNALEKAKAAQAYCYINIKE
jgi:hypothetical protein